MRNIYIIILLIATIFKLSLADSVITRAVCGITPETAVRVWTKATMTLYNVFPIRIGGIQITTVSGLEDYMKAGNFPICVCTDPFPRIGIKISLWEPIALVEPTKIPYCSPTLGTPLPINIGPGAFSIGNTEGNSTASYGNTGTTDQKSYSYESHYYKFPVFGLLNMFTGIACLDGGNTIDIGYMTELDPLWQNDLWAAILGPEVFLVSNPIAQTACIADSVTANFGFPIDPLWWCIGSWGGVFPMTKTTQANDPMSAQAAIVARMIQKMHRQFMLKGSIGSAGLCGEYPMPIMIKSQYSIFPIYPVPWTKRIPIGRTPLTGWGLFKNIPYKNREVGVWAVYKKRECCAL